MMRSTHDKGGCTCCTTEHEYNADRAVKLRGVIIVKGRKVTTGEETE